jgi:hypothetical protein
MAHATKKAQPSYEQVALYFAVLDALSFGRRGQD